jgi:hypothetical protein
MENKSTRRQSLHSRTEQASQKKRERKQHVTHHVVVRLRAGSHSAHALSKLAESTKEDRTLLRRSAISVAYGDAGKAAASGVVAMMATGHHHGQGST